MFRALSARRRAPAPVLLLARRRVNVYAQQVAYDEVEPEPEPEAAPARAALATPRQLVKYLDEYVVGQEHAKKALAVAVYNHYARVRANIDALDEARALEYDGEAEAAPASLRPHPRRSASAPRAPGPPAHTFMPAPAVEKSNVLIIGPTGSGKTLLVRTLARVLDVPFSVSDATAFTQAGYVGEDADACIARLLAAAHGDASRASTGIVYIDEADKLARRASPGAEGGRDVGGEGVQQALLRMLEGAVVPLPPADGGRAKPGRAPKAEGAQIDTSNILFILSGAFEGLPKIIRARAAAGSIGFTAPLKAGGGEGGEAPPGFFTPNQPSGDILRAVQPADLIKYGLIPEFVARLPTITTLSPLTPSDLRAVLSDVRGALAGQYAALLGYSGVELRLTGGALDAICRRAAERGGGARGLRGIMEALLLDAMYETPGSDIRYVLVDARAARGERAPLYFTEREAGAFWARWAAENDQPTP